MSSKIVSCILLEILLGISEKLSLIQFIFFLKFRTGNLHNEVIMIITLGIHSNNLPRLYIEIPTAASSEISLENLLGISLENLFPLGIQKNHLGNPSKNLDIPPKISTSIQFEKLLSIPQEFFSRICSGNLPEVLGNLGNLTFLQIQMFLHLIFHEFQHSRKCFKDSSKNLSMFFFNVPRDNSRNFTKISFEKSSNITA